MWSCHCLSFSYDQQLQWVDGVRWNTSAVLWIQVTVGWNRLFWKGLSIPKSRFTLTPTCDGLKQMLSACISLEYLGNAFPFWYKPDLRDSQSDHKGNSYLNAQIEPVSLVVCHFPLTLFTLLNNTPHFGLTSLLKGEMTGKLCGWQ